MGSKKFLSHKCRSWDDFLKNTCKNNPITVPMGEPVPVHATGSYYLTTESSPPYAQANIQLNYVEDNNIGN